uniref:Uncharacterized protein n=1 Tax=Oryza glumipatula TaxID=40148 RepID=A0A0E0BHZ1_9ORYZ
MAWNCRKPPQLVEREEEEGRGTTPNAVAGGRARAVVGTTLRNSILQGNKMVYNKMDDHQN